MTTAATESSAEAPLASLDEEEGSAHPVAPRARSRPLLAALVLQVVAQTVSIVEMVQVRLLGRQPAALDDSAWIRVALAAGLLSLIVVAGAGHLRRHGAGSPAGYLALGAAIAAQAFLVLGSIVKLTRDADVGVAAAGGPLNAAVGALVFLLTLVAYLTLRSPATTKAIGLGARRVLQDRTPFPGVALAAAASLVVLTGSLASASRSTSPVACVDVSRDVGIGYRSGFGNAVVDGSDLSVAMQQNMGNGVAVGDYNGDGNLDLYLLGQPGYPNRLYRNDHTAAREGFIDVTDAAGLGGFSGSRAAQFVDLNSDGLLDLVVVDDYMPGTALAPSRIYENLGDDRFRDVTAGSGFNPVGVIVGGFGIADYNRDGLPDLYVAYWAGGMELGPTYGSHNLLFENLGDLRFRDVTEGVGLGALSTGSFTPIFSDLNGDGWPDLYVSIDGAPERLFINDHGRFHDATTESGLGTVRNGMGAALVDLDGAGIPSVYVTNITEPELLLGTPPGGDALLRSRLPPGAALTYVDVAAAAGVRDAGWGWGATFADLNLDGSPDLFVAQGMHVATRGISEALTNDRAHVFVGTGPGTFVASTNNGCDIPGDQRAVVAFDYNRDGAPDLLVSQVGDDYALLENRSQPVGHWLTVVAQPTAGHSVVGARVTVTAGGRRWVQTMIGGGSYLAGPPNEAYFGLGPKDRVTSVAIDWPDGTTTTMSDLTADRLLLMRQP